MNLNDIAYLAQQFESPFKQEAKRGNKYIWSAEEHNLFLHALAIYGRNDAQSVSEYIKTRTRAYVHSHAQKYFYKIDYIVHNSVEQAAQYARLCTKQINWNLLQNGLINEPNYEWCSAAQAGRVLILGAAFASPLRQISCYVLRHALSHFATLKIANPPHELMNLQVKETQYIGICVAQSANTIYANGTTCVANLISCIYAQDQFLCVNIAQNGVAKSLERIFRVMLIYQELTQYTQDHPMFIIKNLATFERIDEDTVCGILLALCIHSALTQQNAQVNM